VHARLREHRIVLDLRLAEGRAVRADEDELGLALAQRLHRRLVPQHRLARLHHQREARVDVLRRVLLLLGDFLSGSIFINKRNLKLSVKII